MMSNLVPVDNDVTHIPCPQCGGEGRVEYERPVVDYERGGYLEGYYDECEINYTKSAILAYPVVY